MTNNKTWEEKRKSLRYECLIPSDVLELEGNHNLIKGAAVLDFSREGLKLTVSFIEPNPGSNAELKLYLPERQFVTSLTGEIIWSRFTDNKLEVGLRIKDMENLGKKEILDWVLPKWIEKVKEKRNKEELHNILIKS